MNFGQAIEAMQQGSLVAREGWNGKGMFLFIRPEFTCNMDGFQKIVSVPDKAKAKISEFLFAKGELTVRFTPFITMFAANGTIVNGWLASQTDILSNDWVVL